MRGKESIWMSNTTKVPRKWKVNKKNTIHIGNLKQQLNYGSVLKKSSYCH